MGEPSSFIDEIGAPDPTWTVVEATATDNHYLPAIPEPTTTPVPELLDACAAIVEWAEHCDDATEVQEVYERMVAVAKYLSRQDHALTAETYLRRLEVRIGELLPEPSQGRRTDLVEPLYRDREDPSTSRSLEKSTTTQFRKMAAHPQVVDEVIAESTDASPPSRRKVLDAIKNLEEVARAATPAAAPAKAQRRNPLPDAARLWGWELTKVVEKGQRIYGDNRFTANREQVAADTDSHLSNAIKVLQDLRDRNHQQKGNN